MREITVITPTPFGADPLSFEDRALYYVQPLLDRFGDARGREVQAEVSMGHVQVGGSFVVSTSIVVTAPEGVKHQSYLIICQDWREEYANAADRVQSLL